jgi:phenylalanyl-tRNA synthetase beta subunit
VRRALTALGFDEAYSFSFVNGERDKLFRRDDRPVATLSNPIDVNQSEMRASLITGLLDAVQHNFNQGIRDVKLFELGRVFGAAGPGERPLERELLGVAMTGSSPLSAYSRRELLTSRISESDPKQKSSNIEALLDPHKHLQRCLRIRLLPEQP